MHRASGMHQELITALAAIRKTRNFNVSSWIDRKTDMLNEYMTRCGLKACCVSVSGGIDSSATLALCLHAKAKVGTLVKIHPPQPNSPIKRVVAIAQPIHSTPSIQQRAYEVAKALGGEIITVDQSDLHISLVSKIDTALGVKGEKFATGQLRSYMRTPVGYYVAQLLSQQGLPCIVMGTGNLDEDGYLAYFCKAGDGVVDVQLIADIHKSEVYQVANFLKCPESVVEAAPSADLWEGQTDEEELGISYDFIELYLEYLKLPEADQTSFKAKLSAPALTSFETSASQADGIHRRNKHKLHFPHNINVF